jgi:hypothetical protein
LAPLDLDLLEHGFSHIPGTCGESMAQAAAICFERNEHTSGAVLRVDGRFQEEYMVTWSIVLTEAMRRFWNDPEEATEQGACGLAILLIRSLTGLTVLERSRKGTGFDWWLGEEDNLFQGKARLEVSGILRGSASQLNKRMAAKKKQIERSDSSGLTAYIVVVEFSTPRAKVIER